MVSKLTQYRYIIETTLLHAQILNRTAVLPGYVYARACEFDQATCGAFAEQVNRGKATGMTEWDELPEAEQQGWKIPLAVSATWIMLENRLICLTRP